MYTVQYRVILKDLCRVNSLIGTGTMFKTQTLYLCPWRDSVSRFSTLFYQKTPPGPHKTVSRNVSFSRRYSRKTCVRVRLRGHGQEYADIFKNMWRPLTDFKGTIRWKKVLGCVNKPNINKLKIQKRPYLKKNVRVRVVIDYADTRFSNFANEYLCKNEKVRITVFACSYGPQVESLK